MAEAEETSGEPAAEKSSQSVEEKPGYMSEKNAHAPAKKMI